MSVSEQVIVNLKIAKYDELLHHIGETPTIGIASEITLKNVMYTPEASTRLEASMNHPELSVYAHINNRENVIGISHSLRSIISKQHRSRCLTELMIDDTIQYVIIKLSLEEYIYSYVAPDDLESRTKPVFPGHKCQNKDGFIIHWDARGHANVIVIDKKRQEIERFEPHGTEDVLIDRIDERLQHIFSHLIPNAKEYHYVAPRDYYSIGPQVIENNSNMRKSLQGTITGGFCGWWCILYLCSRLPNNVNRHHVMQTLTTMDPDLLFDLIWWFREQLLLNNYLAVSIRLIEMYSP